MIKAVFFDVDGTLLSHTCGRVPDDARAALTVLRQKGILCVLATGRHMLELRALPLRDLEFDGYLTLNGQLCCDGRGGLLWGSALPESEKELLVTLFRAQTLPLMLVEQERMYLNFVDQRVQLAQAAISTEIPETGIYTGSPIYQAIAYAGEREARALAQRLPGCAITRWNPYAVDIIARGGGKASAIAAFLAHYGIDPSETMAFGDGENDMEMLRFAGIGVAMGNAPDMVKQCADYVTADIDGGGIVLALKHFRLLD